METIVAGCLFVTMLVSLDIGYRVGHRRKSSDPQTSIEVIGTVDELAAGHSEHNRPELCVQAERSCHADLFCNDKARLNLLRIGFGCKPRWLAGRIFHSAHILSHSLRVGSSAPHEFVLHTPSTRKSFSRLHSLIA